MLTHVAAAESRTPIDIFGGRDAGKGFYGRQETPLQTVFPEYREKHRYL
ncbi:hypothetical protein [uncultured Thiocystis sp.]|jgi:hypothetical protein|nr:hypothetical protein [uncultured Thiocystis sp.]